MESVLLPGLIKRHS